MKRLSTFNLFTCFLFFTVQVYSQEVRIQEPGLFYNLKPGETYLLDIDLQQTTHSEDINSEAISLFSLMKLEFHVDSTGDQEVIFLTVRYRDLLLSMLAPGLDIDINSGTGKNRLLSEMVDSLQKDSFRVVMTRSGELRSMEGLATMFRSLYALPVTDTNEQKVILNTLGEVYGPDSFRSMFSLFISVYPVVQPIQNWTRDFTYFFNTKPVQMVNRYYLTKTTGETVIIQGMGMLNSMNKVHEKTSMGEIKSGVSGSQTYDFQMDFGTGWLKRCVSRQRVMIETTIVSSAYLPTGLKIPSYTETVFEVKGSRLQ